MTNKNYDAFRRFVSKAYPNKVIIEFSDYFAQGRHTNKRRCVAFDLEKERQATAECPMKATIFQFKLQNLGFFLPHAALQEFFSAIDNAECKQLPAGTTIVSVSSEGGKQ